jgi:hypothetical protein
MNLGRLSVNQPILAMVLSIVLLIVGAIAYRTLSVAEYPEVVPPTVVVTAQYPGASAQTISDTVAAPIEQQINGVEDMLYMYSQATSNGQLTITITFKLGTDLDKAQVLVQNRVAIAQPQLPEAVQRNGVAKKDLAPHGRKCSAGRPTTRRSAPHLQPALLQVRDQAGGATPGIGHPTSGRAIIRCVADPGQDANPGLTSIECGCGRSAPRTQTRAASLRVRRLPVRLPAEPHLRWLVEGSIPPEDIVAWTGPGHESFARAREADRAGAPTIHQQPVP